MGNRSARNRARTRAQKRRSPHGPQTTTLAHPRSGRDRADGAVYDAVAARHPGELAAARSRLASLDRDGMALERAVLAGVTRAWEIGWQPRDLVRVGARAAILPSQRWLVDAIARQARTYLDGPVVDAGWRAQLVEVGALDPGAAAPPSWRADDHAHLDEVIRALRWLYRLPGLPLAGPPPGQWTSAGDDRADHAPDAVVAKVRALLAKAESTDFPAEAEALTAKAQELVTRHAIDRVLLEAEDGDEPVARRVHIDEPYAVAKAQLLAQVARANGCSAVWSEGFGFSTVFGFVDDVETVTLLHASLLVQATRAMTAAGRDAPTGARTRSRAFRRAFLFGFATQIGRRLREAADHETADADARAGGALLPVLASREHTVAEAVGRAYPGAIKGRSYSVSDGAGWAAGSAAGMHAHLGFDARVAPPLTPPATP
jgi:hypothetical protein